MGNRLFSRTVRPGSEERIAGRQQSLEQEFHRLAQNVDAYPKGVIHRDFQCQNIMVTPERRPARHRLSGSPHGARLPMTLPPSSGTPITGSTTVCGRRLVDYYVEEMKHHSAGFNEALFRESLLPCRLQRHMQALGAYGFLSRVKGKKYFLKHIPEALRLLKEESSAAQERVSGTVQAGAGTGMIMGVIGEFHG